MNPALFEGTPRAFLMLRYIFTFLNVEAEDPSSASQFRNDDMLLQSGAVLVYGQGVID